MVKTCAELCLQSYDPAATGWTDVDDLRYGIFSTPVGRVLCIRGTANAENWLRDAPAFPARTCAGHLAHKGFVRAFQALCAAGMPTIKGDNIIATGHSLGGAIATLLAEHVGCPVVSFGSPRVYWRLGRAPVLDHTRVVRDDDPVPQVPKFLYSHRDVPLLLRDGDHSLIQVEDHFMAGYKAAVEALCGCR